MKINYPIKYAAMPIIEQVGWCHGLNELERRYGTVCYIVSKCYLINDSTIYTEDGCSIKKYEVVFPYQREIGGWERTIPSYNLYDGNCINSNKVDAVFDSYEDALNDATIKNEKLCKETWRYLPFSKNFIEVIQKKEDEFNYRLSEYKMLENQILIQTDDLKIDKKKTLNNVVEIINNSGKIWERSLYEILQIFRKDKFVVYSISQEQYNELTTLVGQENIDDMYSKIVNAEGLLLHKTKDDFIALAAKEGAGFYYIDIDSNNLCHSDELEEVTREDFECIDEETHVFYTTETIEDLMNSYKTYPDIDIHKIQGPILKKVRK